MGHRNKEFKITRRQMTKVGEGGRAGLKALRFRFLEFALRRAVGRPLQPKEV
jgi:hypothetical protein